MCAVLEISRSGYYKWTNSRVSATKQRRADLLDCIVDIFEHSQARYGHRRVHQQLKRDGYYCNRKTVEKLMREHGIKPKRKRKYKSTTDSKHNLPVVDNALKRKFTVTKPDQAWVSDITYIDTHEGWLYLAVFIDLYSRMVVGWSMSERMTAELVTSAFEMGIQRRGIKSPSLVHSDRGSQYASQAFRQQLPAGSCIQSMSRKGNCWDNAVAESFFGSLKSELVYHHTFKTRNDAQLAIFEFIEIFYNRQRLHSTLGYLTPEEFHLKGKKVA